MINFTLTLPTLEDEFLGARVPGTPDILYDVGIELPSGQKVRITNLKHRYKVKYFKVKKRMKPCDVHQGVNEMLSREVTSLIQVELSDITGLLSGEKESISTCPKR